MQTMFSIVVLFFSIVSFDIFFFCFASVQHETEAGNRKE